MKIVFFLVSALMIPTVHAARPDMTEKVRRGEVTEAYASWWGFDPEDSTRFLQAAIDSGAKRLVVEDMGAPWVVRPLFCASDQTIVFRKGVVLLAKKGEFHGNRDALLKIAGKRNVKLIGPGAVLRMRRSDYRCAPYSKSEWRHALSILGSKNIEVEGFVIEESGGDGIYIGSLKKRNGLSHDITVRNVVCDGNLRQGMSVIGVRGLLVENCVFKNTGGAPPEAGVDLEPNGPNEPLVNCVFRNCVSENNTGDGFDIIVAKSDLSTPPLGVVIENCRMTGNRRGLYYHDGRIPRDGLFAWDGGTVTLSGCTIASNQQNAVFARHKQFSSARMVFSECSFTDNCVSSNAMPDVDVGATGHRAMKPNVFSFKNVTIKQGADRDWLSTTGDGTVLKGFPTLFRGAVEIVDGRGSSRTETLDDAWMERRFKWVPSDEPPVPPRTPPRFRNTKVVDAEPWKMSPLQEVFVCNARFSAAYAFFAPDSGSVTFEVKRHLRKRKSFGTTALQIFDYETGKRVALAVIPDSSLCRVRFDVPKRGFYRFDAPGRRTPFAITAANVPLAIDLTKGVCPFVGCEKDLYFHVSGDRRFACSVNGDGREGLKMELFDPSDSSVWSRSLTGDLGDFFVSETVPASGMWRIRASRAADIFFEDHSIGLSGIDAFLFLSRDRCWYSDSKDR